MTRIEAPRGTHDVLPSDQPLWQKVTGEMLRLCALYGYRRIQTPGFEETALFERTSGAASDVVHKEMYTFKDRSDRSLTLVSWPGTGSAIAASRPRTPFHSSRGRARPSLPIWSIPQ